MLKELFKNLINSKKEILEKNRESKYREDLIRRIQDILVKNKDKKIRDKECYYVFQVSDIEVCKDNFSEQDFELFIFLLLHDRSWYIREWALKYIHVLPIEKQINVLVLRSQDHIQSIKTYGLSEIQKYVINDNVDIFIRNLNNISMKSSLYQKVISLIFEDLSTRLNTNIVSDIFSNIRKYDQAILCQHLFINTEYVWLKMLQLFIELNNEKIDIIFLKNIEIVQSKIWEKSINDICSILLKSSSHVVRLRTMYFLQKRDVFKNYNPESFLFDESVWIQEFIHLYLKDKDIDFRELYITSLNNWENIKASLIWLWLCWKNKDLSLVKNYLHNQPLKIQFAALYSVLKLVEKEDKTFIIELMNSPHKKIRTKVINYFIENRDTKYYDQIHNIFKKSTKEVKMNISNLYKKLKTYTHFIYLLESMLESSDELLNFHKDTLWDRITFEKANYLEPTKVEKEKISELLEQIEKKYSKDTIFIEMIERLKYYSNYL